MIELSTLNILTDINKGDTLVGITGSGSNMEMVLYDSSLMSPTLNFKGTWEPNTSYDTNDVILNNGSSYIATSSFTSSTVFDSTNLSLLAEVGPIGKSGENAYQIALDNGFVGTEVQWLASLKGTNGTDGTDATVTATTALATTTNPKATLGEVTDAALAAIPETEKGVANGVQALDDNGALVAVTTAADGTKTYSSPAAIALLTPSGAPASTNLGSYLQVYDTQLGKMSVDGSSYSGDVSDASITSGDKTEKVSDVLASVENAVIMGQANSSVGTATAISLKTDETGTIGSEFALAGDSAILAASSGTRTDMVSVGAVPATGGSRSNLNIGTNFSYTLNDGTLSSLLTLGSNYTVNIAQSDGSASDTMTFGGGLAMHGTSATGAYSMRAAPGAMSFWSGSSLSTMVEYLAYDGTNTILANSGLVLNPNTTAPASVTSAGTLGEVRFDDNYMYRCVTAGADGSAKWVRFPVDTTWT